MTCPSSRGPLATEQGDALILAPQSEPCHQVTIKVFHSDVCPSGTGFPRLRFHADTPNTMPSEGRYLSLGILQESNFLPSFTEEKRQAWRGWIDSGFGFFATTRMKRFCLTDPLGVISLSNTAAQRWAGPEGYSGGGCKAGWAGDRRPLTRAVPSHTCPSPGLSEGRGPDRTAPLAPCSWGLLGPAPCLCPSTATSPSWRHPLPDPLCA